LHSNGPATCGHLARDSEACADEPLKSRANRWLGPRIVTSCCLSASCANDSREGHRVLAMHPCAKCSLAACGSSPHIRIRCSATRSRTRQVMSTQQLSSVRPVRTVTIRVPQVAGCHGVPGHGVFRHRRRRAHCSGKSSLGCSDNRARRVHPFRHARLQN
jgi:hypothetical protein